MNEFLYDINSALISLALLASMAVAIETGYRIGRKYQASASAAAKSHINAIQGSIIGILALVLGFTFSLALQRFDSRSQAVVDEANAIGTAYLRAQLLPAALREVALGQLRDYIDLRAQDGALTEANHGGRDALLGKAAQAQLAIWRLALQAAALEPNPVTSGLFVQSVNDMIDSFGKRVAELDRHVPEVVLLLLYATLLLTGGIVGHTAGVSGHRPSMISYIMVALIVALVFIIIDLDRPRRGFILVSQKSLVDLQSAIKGGNTLKLMMPVR
jgi:hypothetical protein